MPVLNRIASYAEEMKGWRRHLHAHPELKLDCPETAAFITAQLRSFGVDEIHEGIAQTGLVAIINGTSPGPTIGLRADMDALPMTETTGLPWASTVAGRMHACGHDGHVTMLLGAAKYLAETRNFAGTVALIFQPAEEDGGGGQVMVQAVQTIISRNVYALEEAVISVTQIHTGTASNIIPEEAMFCATIRSFKPEVRDLLKKRFTELVEGHAAAYGVAAQIHYDWGYPATVNDPDQSDFAAEVARAVSGPEAVNARANREMGSEDFSYMLQARPGAYLFLGIGPGAGLHHAAYDFNDEAAPVGASFFARLVERAQPVG